MNSNLKSIFLSLTNAFLIFSIVFLSSCYEQSRSPSRSQATEQESVRLNVSYQKYQNELMVMVMGFKDIKVKRIYLDINGIQYSYKGYQSSMCRPFDEKNNDTIYHFSLYSFDSSVEYAIESRKDMELIIDLPNGTAKGKVDYF
ncbi:MAG: hypothetical protein LBI86_09230 [Treponema sp.]|nr:hypothetical protein [Treponema sp.]